MTTHIKGRNRYADEALTKITVRNPHSFGAEAEVIVIEGGYIETRGPGEFVIAAKHPTATDEEGDSSYVVLIEGAGLVWTDMFGPTQRFTGALLSAQYIEDEDAQEFIDQKGYLKFTPPQREWKPGAYVIEVEHLPYTVKEA